MPKHFWFKFEWDKWRNDPDLRRCHKEAKGFWIDAIAVMEELDTYFLEGTPEDLCRDLVCTMEEFERSIAELKRTGAASISKNKGRVKIISRKILKDVNLTEYNRLKQQESRARRRVKKASNDSSKKEIKSLNLKKEESSNSNVECNPAARPNVAAADSLPEPKTAPQPPPPKTLDVEIFLGRTMAGIANRLGLKSLPDRFDWEKHLRWAFTNNFSADDVLECYDLMRQQDWRDGPITAKSVASTLPTLKDLRGKITGPKGGAHQQQPINEREFQKMLDNQKPIDESGRIN